MGLFKRRQNKPTRNVIFQRHVAFWESSLGATFRLVLDSSGRPQWTWSYDPGLPDRWPTFVATNLAITELEKELGLPLTFPSRDHTAPPEMTDDERRSTLSARLANDPDDLDAKTQLWTMDGEVADPEALVIGKIYSTGIDLGIFSHVFVGVQWQGYPEFADNPGEYGEWFAFSGAQHGGSRINRDRWDVRELPVDQVEARLVFDELHARYLRRDAQRGTPKYH
jgi:hypothetical protein